MRNNLAEKIEKDEVPLHAELLCLLYDTNRTENVFKLKLFILHSNQHNEMQIPGFQLNNI